jgi:DNA-binding helix-hairpin-helix protein with protein kinase domain
VGRPEFTAPELGGLDLRATSRQKSSDLFALAVHIHLLLMGGNHPFLRGRWTGGGEQPGAMTLAQGGHWAGGPGSVLHSHPLAPSLDFLPDDILRLFARAFTIGASEPAARPSASEWRRALLAVRVTQCPRGHQVPLGAGRCPWCAIDEERARRREEREAAAVVPAQQISWFGPSGTPPRPAVNPTGHQSPNAPAAQRSIGSRGAPPPRRISSVQSALLWAAGVLGALAIVIAILIVLNAQDKKDWESPPPTVTNTSTETTPFHSPTAMPAWTGEGSPSYFDLKKSGRGGP